jgi:ketosteroid isomerase-like protein
MKTIIASFILIIVIGCNATKQETNDASNATQLISQYFATFNQHNWQALADYYADSVVLKDPAFGLQPIHQSKADVYNKYVELQKTIPDVNDSVINILASTNHITVEFLSQGTAPDGKKFMLPICTIFGLKAGKIVEDFTYYDNF